MDYIAEINGILTTIQELTIPATYGNTKKLSDVMERLVRMADAMKKDTSKEAAIDE